MPAAAFKRMAKELRRRFPMLSRPQAREFSEWVIGIIGAQCAGLSSVAAFVSMALSQKLCTVRTRLRDFYCDAAGKCGSQRRQIDVTDFFAPLLKWIISRWTSSYIVLALDATQLSDRMTVLSISAVIRGTAVPVAWRIICSGEPQPWKPHWCELLERLAGVVPASMTVIVATDRGLYANWLFQKIQAIGWHPLMRLNQQGTLYYSNGRRSTLAAFALKLSGRAIAHENVTVFSTRPLRNCTLLGVRRPGCADPWIVVSDLPSSVISAECYGFRAWIEQGFKALKKGCFCWNRTKIDRPERAERTWLALATATLFSVGVAITAEDLQTGGHSDNAGALDPASPMSVAADSDGSDEKGVVDFKLVAEGSPARKLSLPRLGAMLLRFELFAAKKLRKLYNFVLSPIPPKPAPALGFTGLPP